MLLRTPEQMALNQVEALCIESADHYVAAAAKAPDPELSRVLRELGEQRKEFASKLINHIHALDDLPRSPDPDREAVDELLVNVKMFFSGNATKTLIEERMRSEDELAKALDAALPLGLPDDTKRFLEEIKSHTDSAKVTLAAARQ